MAVSDVVTNITIDLLRPYPVMMQAVQDDQLSRWVHVTLTENGAEYVVPSGVTAFVKILKPDGTVCFYDSDDNGAAVIIDAGNNLVKILLVAQALTAPGDAKVWVGFTDTDGAILKAFSFTLKIAAAVPSDAQIVSSDYYNVLLASFGATVEVGTVTTTEAGTPVAIENVGTAQHVVLDISMPAGAAAGFGTPTASAETLDPGSTATVEIEATGTDLSKVFAFSFGIPQGETGVQGDTGFAAGFGTPTAVAATLEPGEAATVEVSASGEDTAKIFAFAFGVPKGDTGRGLTLLGRYDTLAALQAAIANPDPGDAYQVGTATPYTVYIWGIDSGVLGWVNSGQLQGPEGEPGVIYIPAVSAEGIISWTNDGGRANPDSVSIKGNPGAPGAAAGFGTPTATATALAAGAAPTAAVTASGEDTAKAFAFAFGIPAGAPGTPGAPGAAGPNEVTANTDSGITGLLKGAAGKVAQAVAGTDYEPATQWVTGVAPTAVTVANNNCYIYDAVASLAITYPASGHYHAWLRVTLDSSGTYSITFPADTTYIGSVPTWAASTVYEIDILDGVVVIGEVGDGA